MLPICDAAHLEAFEMWRGLFANSEPKTFTVRTLKHLKSRY